MWTRSALIGLLASSIVTLALKSQSLGQGGVNWPLELIFVVLLLGTLLQKLFIERLSSGRIYEGLSDLFAQIHSSALSDLSWRWGIRGLISFALVFCAGLVGVEGSAIELVYAAEVQFRHRAEKWFEQRKRTDAACALAAGISAAFGAPFAAVLIPMELGIGGRTLYSVVSSLFAFLGMSLLRSWFSIRTFDLGGALYGFGLLNWKEWLGVGVIAVGSALIGFLLVRFNRFCNLGFLNLARGHGWARMLLGGVVLYMIASSYKGGYAPSSVLLEEVLWVHKAPGEAALVFSAKALSLMVVLSSFGTMGLFWPLFGLGGFFGFSVYEWGFQDVPAFAAAAGLVGAAAFWSSVLQVPIAAAVLVFEVTRNIEVMVPCLLAGLMARELSALLGNRGLINAALEDLGLSLQGGRSLQVLEAITVREAMVADFDFVEEHEAVSTLRGKLVHSRYPYLAVVNTKGLYIGILTIDMVRDAWYTDRTVTSSHSSLSKLLEVKDLLYRSGFEVPVIREDQKLSEIMGKVDRYSCLAVLNEEGRLVGLLLASNVRQSYDREVIRRSLELAEFDANT